MSQNIDRLRAMFDAFNRGDFDEALRYAQPDLELKPAERVTNPGTYRGPKAVRQYIEDLFEPFEEVVVEPEEFLERGDRIFVLLLWRARPLGSTAVLENRVGHLWTMRDGRPARCEIFPDPEEARDALGLLEQELALDAINAWNRQDLAAFLDAWHPECEWRPAFPKGTEGSGVVFRGHEGISQAWRGVREAWEKYRLEVEDARMVAEDLVVLGHIHLRGAESRVELDSPWSAIVRFRNCKIVSAWDWLDHSSALEAVGLSEPNARG